MSAPHVLATATLRLALCSTYRSLTEELDDQPGRWPSVILPGRGDGLVVREMQRQFESIIDRVADELALIQASSLDGVSQDDYFVALIVIAAYFDQLTFNLAAIRNLHERLPSDLHRMFLISLEEEWDRQPINEQVRAYGRSALTLCCYALLAWARLLPTERSYAAWATLVSTTRLIEQSREMLLEVRRAGVSGTGNTVRVVGTQRRDISSALGHIELFGLPGERRFRRVPIDVSYLAGRLTNQPDTPQASGVALNRLVDSLLPSSTKPYKLDHGLRLLITGKAGSGKTTAVQWLAFKASQQGLQTLSQGNRPLLPLYVKLRDAIVSDRPPSDRKLLYSEQLQDEVNAQWLEECRDFVTPLILLDGWDEIPAERRQGTELWIKSIGSRFPDAHIIVTSRPEGVAEGTFRDLAFKHVTVLPLRPSESIELARRWFDGLVDQLYASPDIALTHIEKARRELLQDLRTPTISDIADSPLLISMLCCLYTSGTTSAPDKRGRLYELVVAALLDLRERERGPSEPQWRNLDLSKKEKLVNTIARRMAERGTMTLPIERDDKSGLPHISQMIADVLPVLGMSSAETLRWTNVILNRSVVLQRVSRNEAEFIHRSFQDYLASRSFRDDRYLPNLLSLAEAGQWALLPFACYNASQQDADEIVTWLLDKLTTVVDEAERRKIQFVLIECIGAAAKISPSIRVRADNVIAAVLPPRDESEAKSLASLDSSVVPYLASSRIDDVNARALAIETLSRLGSAEAMAELAHYAREARTADLNALTRAIDRFDPDTYARTVLAEVRRDLSVTVTDEAQLTAMSNLGAVTTLVAQGIRFSNTGLAAAKHISRLRRLDVRNCENVASLEWTTSVNTLRSISIATSSGYGPLVELGPRELWGLHLDNLYLELVNWHALLQQKLNLRVLSITNVDAPRNQLHKIPQQAVSRLANLTTLAITGQVRLESLNFLARNSRKLSHLTLGYVLTSADVKLLSECRALRTLNVTIAGDAQHVTELDKLDSLQKLYITEVPPHLLRQLQGLTSLTEVHLRKSNLGAPSYFELPPNVKTVTMTGCTFQGEISVAQHIRKYGTNAKIEELTWRNGTLTSLAFLQHMRSLKRLDIEDNGSLESLEGLDSVPRGCFVRLVGTRWGLDESPINRLRSHCEVVYEPDYDSDTFTPGFWVDYGGS